MTAISGLVHEYSLHLSLCFGAIGQINRLRRLSRSLSRKEKGSKNRAKAKRKLAMLHARIATIRNDELHKLTTNLASRYGVVVIEDLNVKEMMANHHLARAVGDMGFHEFRRQLAYKTAMRGGQLIIADRWFASSKICSVCETKQESMPLSIREWTCSECGAHHDRDLNAAHESHEIGCEFHGDSLWRGRKTCSYRGSLNEAGIQR